MIKSVKSDIAHSTNTSQSFRQYSDRLVSLLKTEGIVRLPYESPELPIFNSLTSEQQEDSLALLKYYLESLEDVLSAGEKLSNNSTALWCALKKLGIKPPSDFFSHLRETDCIELYDANHIQIWRNLNMMRVMTHTTEQVFCLPWPYRYERDPVALQKCLEIIESLFNAEVPGGLTINIENLILEKESTELLQLDVVHRYAAPVTDNYHQTCGYLVVSSVDIIGSNNDLMGETMEPSSPTFLHLV